MAAGVALVGSIGVDALLVALGEAVFPSSAGYSHYRFWDYGGLSALGVLGACGAWALVIRASAEPRAVLFRLAVGVSLVLWLPDVWLLTRREPIDAVGVLMVMHATVALVTYNSLVHLAPPRPALGPLGSVGPVDPLGPVGPFDSRRGPGAGPVPRPSVSSGTGAGEAPPPRKPLAVAVWAAMLSALGLELVLGVVSLAMVPVGRPDGWLPLQGRAVYLAHAVVGGLLGIGALWVLGAVRRAERIVLLAAAGGLLGVALGAGGGILAVDHPSRGLGMALMLVGSLLAGFAYLVPIVEALPDPAPPASAVAPKGPAEPGA